MLRHLADCDTALTAASTVWALSWAQQQAAGVIPIVIRAYYSAAAHHLHLQGGTSGDWPLNVFDQEQAAGEVPMLRAIASADLHSLVLQGDYRITPATLRRQDANRAESGRDANPSIGSA